ncbi:PepSY domain-containing protein [Enterococcus saigonensis]|uniref:PepSY domain-containing protein n=1 Tax=Enterococcus saigonensis TaxID=1805431 RepID=A0A679IL80_9ENTE|nr:PepSY domain-containing protein [Enterococcus saigonensis]BCA86912.1 PepSY domain-containing protein [Enterococcus saigonensis]
MKKLILTTVVLSGLILAGCQNNNDKNNNNVSSESTTVSSSVATSENQTSSSKVESTVTDKNGIIMPENELFEETTTKFESAHTEAIITNFKWETQGPTGQVEIEGEDSSQEYKMTFDHTGKLIADTSEVNDDKNWQEDEVKTGAVITLTDAIKKAQAQADGSVTSAELEKDDGVTKWELKVLHTNQEIEITLDAQGGKVLNKETDD